MTRLLLLLAVLAVPLAAAAQNKCVDAKGKVTYQEAPCPGSLKPKPAPASSSSPAGVPPRSEESLHREVAELQRCKGDWEALADSMQRSRAQAASLRKEGDPDEAAREEDIARRHLEETMERFLPVCSRHGFVYPRDAQGEKRNAAAAAALGTRVETLRTRTDAMAKRADLERGAVNRLEESKEKQRYAQAKQCMDMLRQMGEQRSRLRNLDSGPRAEREKAIDAIQASYDKSCRGE